MMDFSGSAGTGSDFDLLPKGMFAWAILSVRGVKGSGSGGQYIDCELTIAEGQPYAGRKLWDMIGHPYFQGNSEKYRQMGMVAVTRILEAGRNAGPHNPDGYKIDDFSQLNGLKVAIKVGVEEGSGGHDDKNRVAEWLTPNPASQSGYKGFQKLIAGDHNLGNGQAATAPATGGFGGAPAAPAAAGGFGNGGFGQGGRAAAATQPAATTGFGNTGSGFQQPPADSSGQSGASSAVTADKTPGAAPATSPSDPAATPGWLSQAGAQA